MTAPAADGPSTGDPAIADPTGTAPTASAPTLGDGAVVDPVSGGSGRSGRAVAVDDAPGGDAPDSAPVTRARADIVDPTRPELTRVEPATARAGSHRDAGPGGDGTTPQEPSDVDLPGNELVTSGSSVVAPLSSRPDGAEPVGTGSAAVDQAEDHSSGTLRSGASEVFPTRAPRDPGTSTAVDDERYARAWLSRAAEPGDRFLWAFVETYGAVATMRALRRGEAPEQLQKVVGRRHAEDRTADDLRLAERRGIRLVVPGDSEWPAQALRPMAYAAARGSTNLVPPLAFWVRGVGRLDAAAVGAVAMVGSRAASEYGLRAAEELGYGLAERGWTIVSGGAYGIDAGAHKAALGAGGTTVAVLAGGLDKPYPAGNAALFERINDTGLLVSEWPPGCAPMRRRFLIRNRVVAGLAAGTIVVEAAARSGAHSTAARARELGQPLMVVPGPVFSAMSVGCLALLRTEGVRPVGTIAHVLEEIGRIGDDLAPPESGHTDVRDDLDTTQRVVLDAVPVRRPAPVERIAVAAGVSTGDVLRVLPALELSDLVELTDRGWRLGSAARRRTGASAGGRSP